MRLPIIKHINEFVKSHDEDFVKEAVVFLEHLADSASIKEHELDVIGELLSNIYGALEVRKLIDEGHTEKDAMNAFMKRVVGSIER